MRQALLINCSRGALAILCCLTAIPIVWTRLNCVSIQEGYWALWKGWGEISSGIIISFAILSFWPYVRDDVEKLLICNLLLLSALIWSVSPSCFYDSSPTHNGLVILQFAFGMTICRCMRSSQRVAILASVVVAILVMLTVGLGKNTHFFYSGHVIRLSGIFNSPDELSFAMLVLLPQILGLLIVERSAAIRLTLLLILLAGICLLQLTFYRTAAIANCLATVSVTWKILRHKKPVFIVALPVLLLVVFTVGIRSFDPASQLSTTKSNFGHIMLIRSGWDEFCKHWLTGVGVGCVRIPLTWGRFSKQDSTMAQPENLLLCWLDEIGIVGGCLVIAWVSVLYRILHMHRTSQSAGLSGAWVALGILSLTCTPIGFPNQVFQNCLVGGLIASTLMLGPDSQLDRHRCTNQSK